MVSMYKSACLLLALLALCARPGLAGTPAAPIVVGFYDFPPSVYTDADGYPQGPLVDLTRKVFRQAGHPVALRSLPSARIYAGLQDGSVQVWLGSPKPQLAEHLLAGSTLLAELTLNLYYRDDTPPPRVPVDLVGRSLVTIIGYSYFPGISHHLDDPRLGIVQHRTRTHTAALEMLLRQRGDYLLDYSLATETAAAELGVPVPAHVELQRLPMNFLVSRHQPHPERLLADLERAYGELLAAGEDLSLPGDLNYRRGLARDVGSATSGSSGQ
ncbi:hypothetical protein D9M68_430680 [compost metagenome]